MNFGNRRFVFSLFLVAALTWAYGFYLHSELSQLRTFVEVTSAQLAETANKAAIIRAQSVALAEQISHVKQSDGSGRSESDYQTASQVQQAESQAWMKAMLECGTDPNFRHARDIYFKARLFAHYAAFFRSLNLNPDQLTRLKSLLEDRESLPGDVLVAMRKQGVNPVGNIPEIKAAIAAERSSLADQFRGLLGDSGYTQLQNYDQTEPQRALVSRLQQSLSYSPAALTEDQANQLQQILTGNPFQNGQRTWAELSNVPGAVTTYFTDGTSIPVPMTDADYINGFNRYAGNEILPPPDGSFIAMARINPEAVSKAAAFLSEPQIEALNQMVQTQQAEQELSGIVRQYWKTNQN